MAPSTYALDYINSVELEATARAKALEQVEGVQEQLDRKIEVLPENKAREVSLSRGNLARAIFALAVIGAIFVSSVWMGAKMSSIKYSINQITKENVALNDEITKLKIEIASTNSIEYVETMATEQLEMVYPTQAQTIYIAKEDLAQQNVAEIIKEKAYKN